MAEDNKELVGKGKAKAAVQTITASGDAGEQELETSSVGNRIFASASGLARDLLAGNNSLSSSLGETAASSGKVRPIAQNHNLERSIEASQIGSSSGVNGRLASANTESFRTSGADPSAIEAFEDFQQQTRPVFEQASPIQDNRPSEWAAEFELDSNHVQEYSGEDGFEVAQLLSDPYFVAMTEDAEPEPAKSAEDAADLFGDDFDADTAQAARAMRETLPAPPIHQPVAADHPRNLVANFEALLAGSEPQKEARSYSAASMVHFHSQEQQREFYSQWSGVLNQYTDEVWGDMLPVVQEEKKHAEAIKSGKEMPDSKSVQRLNMILGHIEDYRHWRG